MAPNIYKTQKLGSDDASIELASELIKRGEVVGMPTETVYGLAANALDEAAVKKIFMAKGRPSDNPLIVHIADINMLFALAKNIPQIALDIVEKFWPGPLTVVLEKTESVPYITSGGLDTVGIRMPDNEAALRLIRKCARPLAAPSANTSGKPSPTSADHVFADMNGKIPAIIDGGECKVGVESTVICFDNDSVRILRPGYITAEQLQDFCNVIIDKNVLSELESGAVAASPGMKYKHYSPKAEVFLVESSADKFFEYVRLNAQSGDYLVIFDSDVNTTAVPDLRYGSSTAENAHEIFKILRNIDDCGAKRAFVRAPSKNGVGLAVYNRLIRAAGFKVITLD